MDLVKQYWPTLLGAITVVVAAVVLWPEGGASAETEPARGLTGAFGADPGTSAPEVEATEGDQAPRPASEANPGSPPEQEYEIVETVIAVPVEVAGTADAPGPTDAEAKAALSQVDVVLYQTNECQFCQAAREFFDHNEVRYAARDVNGDERIRLLARRLSGGSSVPVIVVDGQVLRGFSEASVQAALTSAVERRVLRAR